MAEAAVELRAILDSAEQAAAAQDFVSAEHYLRQAAVIQEVQLGPAHPDLANTLNNLGIVLEKLGKPSDAEASYRRAYAIATATRAPDDPLVATSRQNLRDFCAAAGRPFELAQLRAAPSPAPPPAPVSKPRPIVPPPARSVPVTPPPPRVSRPATPAAAAGRGAAKPAAAVVRSPVRAGKAPATSRRSYLNAIALASAIAILALIAWLVLPSRTSVAPTAAPATAPAPPEGIAVSTEEKAETVGPRQEATPAVAKAPPAAVNERPRSAPQVGVSVVEARLCRSLSPSDWQCTPLTSPAEPGRVFFYTRVKAGRDTTVRHRWYVNGNLLQNVELRIGANAGPGFRTYSRNTVAAERRGTWTIELRDADGALLHQERFVVQ
jgi:hypothetical protein